MSDDCGDSVTKRDRDLNISSVVGKITEMLWRDWEAIEAEAAGNPKGEIKVGVNILFSLGSVNPTHSVELSFRPPAFKDIEQVSVETDELQVSEFDIDESDAFTGDPDDMELSDADAADPPDSFDDEDSGDPPDFEERFAA